MSGASVEVTQAADAAYDSAYFGRMTLLGRAIFRQGYFAALASTPEPAEQHREAEAVAWLYTRNDGDKQFVDTTRWAANMRGKGGPLSYVETPLYTHPAASNDRPEVGGEAVEAVARMRPDGCVGEMTPNRAAYFLERFKRDEKMLGPHEQWALDYALAAIAAMPLPPAPGEGE